MTKKYREGLELARLLMVLSSMSPLFVLWAIRGNDVVPDCYLWLSCALVIIVSSGFLRYRIWRVKKSRQSRSLSIDKVEENRGHLGYLFMLLLPLYADTPDTVRDFAATLVALVFVVFIFYHLNYHYINILFALCGYRVFTLHLSKNTPLSGKSECTLIAPRGRIASGDSIMAYRLSDTVYFEARQ